MITQWLQKLRCQLVRLYTMCNVSHDLATNYMKKLKKQVLLLLALVLDNWNLEKRCSIKLKHEKNIDNGLNEIKG